LSNEVSVNGVGILLLRSGKIFPQVACISSGNASLTDSFSALATLPQRAKTGETGSNLPRLLEMAGNRSCAKGGKSVSIMAKASKEEERK
jgi:hypothetical protein